MDIAEKVKKIIAVELDWDPADLKPESDLIKDLGADSLAFVEITLKLETEFDINIPDEVAEKVRTVGEVIAYIEQRTAGG